MSEASSNELVPGTRLTGDDIAAIAASLNYLWLGNPTVITLAEVAAELEERAQSRCESCIPVIHIMLTAGSATLSIGDVVVWDSEEDEHSDLTLANCLRRYQERISEMSEMFLPDPDENPT